MNKQDKIIALLLGLALAGWLVWNFTENRKQAEARAKAAAETAQASLEASKEPAAPAAVAKPEEPPPAPKPAAPVAAPRKPERLVALTNGEMVVTLSSRGAVVKGATLLAYAEKAGRIGPENPALTLDFTAAPALALEGVPGLAADADWEVVGTGADFVLFRNAVGTRRVALKAGYRLAVEERLAPAAAAHTLSLGCMALGASKNDLLSIDSWASGGKEPHVIHHGEEEPLKGYLVGSAAGCSGSKGVEGIPVSQTVDVPGEQAWVAVKNRFFVTALADCTVKNTGFRATMNRDANRREYALQTVAAAAAFAAVPAERDYTLYIGPKKQSLLWDLGMKDVMEFGMFRWVCYPMVWILNLFDSWIPSYGIAIILLTILVRLVFWPLTHKSTVSMRRMQEIQPKIKAVQQQFKGNPQRLQQETWAVYRENKVNPMASCLPMLVQIPVFIALFNVLRAAVELRYAPFLWIADLSEPEALFASWFPFGGLNILPILMAATMALQSALTPSTGDKNQQRMMMVMMPAMMLFMFYSFPSALSLYWTLSQVFSIVQMWWIRRKYGTPAAKADGVTVPDAVEMPQTRQMRRHGA